MTFPIKNIENDAPVIGNLGFDIIIDESFTDLCSDESITPKENKRVLDTVVTRY